MLIQADDVNKIVRLYDSTKNNPNELNIAAGPNGMIQVGLEDRDGGNTELWITVERAELVAAIAVAHVSENLSVRESW